MRKSILAAILTLAAATPALATPRTGIGSIPCEQDSKAVRQEVESHWAQMSGEQQKKFRDLLDVAAIRCAQDEYSGEQALSQIRDELNKTVGR